MWRDYPCHTEYRPLMGSGSAYPAIGGAIRVEASLPPHRVPTPHWITDSRNYAQNGEAAILRPAAAPETWLFFSICLRDPLTPEDHHDQLVASEIAHGPFEVQWLGPARSPMANYLRSETFRVGASLSESNLVALWAHYGDPTGTGYPIARALLPATRPSAIRCRDDLLVVQLWSRLL